MGASRDLNEASDRAGLTWLEARFCEAYAGAAAGNGRKAAEMAGYTGTYGSLCTMASALLRRVEVKDYLHELQENDPLVMSRAERLRFLSGVVRATEMECKVDPETGETVQVKPVMRDRLTAAKMLGEAAGEHIKVKVEVEDHSRLSTAEIDAMLAEMRGTR